MAVRVVTILQPVERALLRVAAEQAIPHTQVAGIIALFPVAVAEATHLTQLPLT